MPIFGLTAYFFLLKDGANKLRFLYQVAADMPLQDKLVYLAMAGLGSYVFYQHVRQLREHDFRLYGHLLNQQQQQDDDSEDDDSDDDGEEQVR